MSAYPLSPTRAQRSAAGTGLNVMTSRAMPDPGIRTLIDTIANEYGTVVHEASAQHHDILFAFANLSLESPEALHINPSL